MRYLLDTNTLSKSLIGRSLKRDDLFILDEVVDEWAFTQAELTSIKTSGIRTLTVSKKHLDKLVEVLTSHGDNFKLIRLYTGEGTADVVMLAYILAEKDDSYTLFPEDYVLVTQDRELISIATAYGIKSVPNLP